MAGVDAVVFYLPLPIPSPPLPFPCQPCPCLSLHGIGRRLARVQAQIGPETTRIFQTRAAIETAFPYSPRSRAGSPSRSSRLGNGRRATQIRRRDHSRLGNCGGTTADSETAAVPQQTRKRRRYYSRLGNGAGTTADSEMADAKLLTVRELDDAQRRPVGGDQNPAALACKSACS